MIHVKLHHTPIMKKLACSSVLALFLAMPSARAADVPTIIEAEAATLGADFSTGSDGSVSYVTCSDTTSGYAPTTAAAMASKSISLPMANTTYELYARVYAPSASADSFFYGAGFGTGNVNQSWTWISADNLGTQGFTASGDTVTTGGTAGTNVWKWVKISGMYYGAIYLACPSWTATRSFTFAAREGGLRIDKFALCPLGSTFTVNQLDNGLSGSRITLPADVPTGPALASGKSKFLGCAYSEDADQNVNFTDYWNQVIPGNAGKWGSVESARDSMNWTNLDNCYDFAKAGGYPFMFHVLVWGSQQPSWVTTLSASDQLDEIKEWFQAVATRYPEIDILQVVNEPLSAPPAYKAALGGDGSTGWDWVIEAFTLARQYFPNTPLMINDYNIVSDTTRANTYVTIINLLKDRGLIDAIGIQGHGFSYAYASTDTITTCLKKLTDTGLPVYVTEMDVNGITDEYQLSEFQRVFPIFWENPDVYGVTMWGYRLGLWRSDFGCFLVDWNGQERPAFEWLRHYVQSYEDWQGCDVTDNWADTGSWLGSVYVGFAPWVYVADGSAWVYCPSGQPSGDGFWGYAFNPESAARSIMVTRDTWLSYTITNGWVDTGAWLGDVYVGYSPWVLTEKLGWMYLFTDTVTNSGGWAWLQK
jgi:endo-1,4-beta-xylanase